MFVLGVQVHIFLFCFISVISFLLFSVQLSELILYLLALRGESVLAYIERTVEVLGLTDYKLS